MIKPAVLIFLIFNLSLSAQQYFYSNSLAMERDEIFSIELVNLTELEWILKRTVEVNSRETVLYHFGEEHKRSFKTDLFYREYIDGILVEETGYRKDGQISKIVKFNSDGSISEMNEYEYKYNDELISISRFDGLGTLLSKLEYSMREDGSLRTISLFADDALNHRESWNSFKGSLFMEERTGSTNRELVFYNEDSSIEKILQFDQDELIFEKFYSYYPDGVLKEIKKNSLINGEISIESMNDRGQVIKEDVFSDDLFLFSIKYSYRGSLLTEKTKTGSQLSERWIYHYRDDELTGEDFYRQKVLEQKKKITDSDTNSYIIELYDSGKHFMNLIYVDDIKIREEYISGDKIIRTRELGES